MMIRRQTILLIALLIVGCDEILQEEDCVGVVGGTAELDNCNVCDMDRTNDCVPDCSGKWGGDAVDDCNGLCGGSAIEDCAGECGGSSVLDECDVCNGEGIADGKCDCSGKVEDACGVCGGDTNSEDECSDASCDFEVCISIINVNNNSLDIGMISSIFVAGFQFNINGITITTASGGVAEENGLSVSTSSNMILGFSISGALIPAGNNELIHIKFTENSGTICLVNPVFSSQSGEPLSVSLGDFSCD